MPLPYTTQMLSKDTEYRADSVDSESLASLRWRASFAATVAVAVPLSVPVPIIVSSVARAYLVLLISPLVCSGRLLLEVGPVLAFGLVGGQ